MHQQVQVNLRTSDGEYQCVVVHRAVLTAFKGSCPPGMEGCHGPNGYLDNSVTNLYWDTHRNNSGRDRVRDGTINSGERNGASKLNSEDIQEIRRLLRLKTPRRKIATKFKISTGNLSYIAREITWSE